MGIGLSLLAASCGPEMGEDVEDTQGAILNGAHESDTGFPGAGNHAVAMVTSQTGTCSGVYINNNWVLTADHCLYNQGVPQGVNAILIRPDIGASSTFPPQGSLHPDRIVHHPTLDAALMHLPQALDYGQSTSSVRQRFLTPAQGDVTNKNVTCIGFGRTTVNGQSGFLNKGLSRVSGVGPTLTTLVPVPGATNQLPLEGDSGGPCYFTAPDGRDYLVGIVKSGNPAVSATLTNDKALRGWVRKLASPAAIVDYDADGLSDVAVYRPESPCSSLWWIASATGTQFQSTCFGDATYTGWAGDFDGDGLTELAAWQGTTGQWRVKSLATGATTFTTWGLSTSGYRDTPALGDYDGDGKTDYAIWRRNTSTFIVKKSSNGGTWSQQWGQFGDIAVPGDYDGDGKTDFAVYRPSTTEWWTILSSTGAGFVFAHIGVAGENDQPVPGDYDGDGKTDVAVVSPSGRQWQVLRSTDGGTISLQWGQPTDVLVPADYDGDGKTDPAVYRVVGNQGTWYLLLSSTSYFGYWQVDWGAPGDAPLERAPRP
jgi:hypothetical protein